MILSQMHYTDLDKESNYFFQIICIFSFNRFPAEPKLIPQWIETETPEFLDLKNNTSFLPQSGTPSEKQILISDINLCTKTAAHPSVDIATLLDCIFVFAKTDFHKTVLFVGRKIF